MHCPVRSPIAEARCYLQHSLVITIDRVSTLSLTGASRCALSLSKDTCGQTDMHSKLSAYRAVMNENTHIEHGFLLWYHTSQREMAPRKFVFQANTFEHVLAAHLGR